MRWQSLKQRLHFIIQSAEERIEKLTQEITILEKGALDIIRENSELQEKHQLLTSVKGIADKSAIKLLGEVMVLSPDMTAKTMGGSCRIIPSDYPVRE